MSEVSIDLTDVDQEGRFSRFELITWWEQERLAKAKFLVIGAGALGNEILKNCALSGCGILATNSGNASISGNTVTGAPAGITVTGSPGAEVSGNEVCGSTGPDLSLDPSASAARNTCGVDCALACQQLPLAAPPIPALTRAAFALLAALLGAIAVGARSHRARG